MAHTRTLWLVVASCACASGSPDPAYEFGDLLGNNRHYTGIAAYDDERDPKLVWFASHPGLGAVYQQGGEDTDEGWHSVQASLAGPPLLAGQSTVVMPLYDAVEAMVRYDGEPLWRHELPADTIVRSPAARGADGTLYLVGEQQGSPLRGRVWSVSSEGEALWTAEPGWEAPRGHLAVGHNKVYTVGFGPIVEQDQQSALAALDEATGDVQWKVPLTGFGETMSLGPDAVYVSGFADGAPLLMAHDAQTGAELWTLVGPGAPVVAADGTLYAGGEQGLWAISPEGQVQWRHGSSPCLMPALVRNDYLVSACGQARARPVVLRGEDGRVDWEAGDDFAVDGTTPGPVVVAGHLYFMSQDPTSDGNSILGYRWATERADAWWQREGASHSNEYRLLQPVLD